MQSKLSKPTASPNVLSPAVLSKGVSGSAAAPQSWPEGYVLVPKKSVSATSPSSSISVGGSGGGAADRVRSDVNARDVKSVDTSDDKCTVVSTNVKSSASRRVGSSQVVDDGDGVETFFASIPASVKAMREELLHSRFTKFDHSSNQLRHAYTVNNFTVSTTPNTTITNAVPQTTVLPVTNDERIGTIIRNIRLKADMVFNCVYSAASSTPPQVPMIRLTVWRDFVPLAPGSVPPSISTDANPPASGAALFTCLGNNRAVGWASINAMRNPLTAKFYHIYLDECISFVPPASGAVTSLNVMTYGPTLHHKRIDVDLHGVQSDFTTSTGASLCSNAIYISVSSSDTTTYGSVIGCQMNVDLIFDDGTSIQATGR